jgi:hypothetical protein
MIATPVMLMNIISSTLHFRKIVQSAIPTTHGCLLQRRIRVFSSAGYMLLWIVWHATRADTRGSTRGQTKMIATPVTLMNIISSTLHIRRIVWSVIPVMRGCLQPFHIRFLI